MDDERVEELMRKADQIAEEGERLDPPEEIEDNA
jgi:hypothetical protein